jgi:hypothetical protein
MSDDELEDIPDAQNFACRPGVCECSTGKGNWQNYWRLAWVGCVRPGGCEADIACCGCEYSIGEICPCVTPGGRR